MFPLYGRDTRTDNERYLEDELQRSRDAVNELYRRKEEEREERRREQRQEMEWDERHPDNWPQAFQNQANLLWREHNQFLDLDDGDDFFKHSAEANEKALELWKVVSDSKKTQIEDLQRQIDAVWESVRLEVAEQLEKSSEVKEYKWVASAIRDDQLDGYCDW